MESNKLSPSQIREYHRDGYVVIREFCNKQEVDKLYSTAVEDSILTKNALDLSDLSGKKTRLSLWFTPGNDVFGYLTRSERMVNVVSQLMDSDSPVCHFHYKMMQKEPKVGGAWEWHQDYGYWYGDKCLFPDLASCMVAVTRASRENGCLQVLRGSNLMGRIDHGRVGGQAGADPERINACLQRFELVHGELEPGDALFFHGNTLHSSAPNTSDHPRWSFITCYNAMSNVPYDGKGHGKPIEIVVDPDDDAAVLQAARRQLERLQVAGAQSV